MSDNSTKDQFLSILSECAGKHLKDQDEECAATCVAIIRIARHAPCEDKLKWAEDFIMSAHRLSKARVEEQVHEITEMLLKAHREGKP